ncbi:hypothetical protein LXA47_17715 [Massilia sp. P8910]|uniref:hypothetical protein n=1 Tax=Massilia antarctica TaxID=2765360 RepID=UPI001E2ED5EB|nr:hypothetical protein [Massilia antarctica]MCE3605426.1 hypothetical protein [Massilia antarctica]
MATYEQIRSDVRSSTGKTMQNCWIAHVKELNGLAPKTAPNRKSLSERVKPCPDHIRPLIEASMRRLGLLK